MVKVNVKHNDTKGGLTGLLDRLRGVSSRRIYVGIPQSTASRGKGPINNAELLYAHTHGIRRQDMRAEMGASIRAGAKYSTAYKMYIMSHGSPLWQVPPRPVIEPAIEHYKDAIAVLFCSVIRAAAKGDEAATQKAMHKCGMKAQNVCRDWFVNPANGWDPNSPFTVKRKGSDKPLIDTGALRKAITYVVRDV